MCRILGSILAVTSSDKHTPGKTLRFTGICIKREGCGLRAQFILRNVIDNQVCNSIVKSEVLQCSNFLISNFISSCSFTLGMAEVFKFSSNFVF